VVGAWRFVLLASSLAGCYVRPDSPEGCGYGDWSPKMRLPNLNTSGTNQQEPALSEDNQRLMYTSVGVLYEATYNPATLQFDDERQVMLPILSGGPQLSRDALTLYFNFYVQAAQAYDVATVTRSSLTQPFDPATFKMVPGLNSMLAESDVSFSADMLDAVLVLEGDDRDIAITSRAKDTDPFAPPVVIPTTVNHMLYTCCPTISPDGLTVMWTGYSPYGVWQTTRPTRRDPFEPATLFGPLQNESNRYSHLNFSYDGTILVFSYDEDSGDSEDNDLYMMERTKTCFE